MTMTERMTEAEVRQLRSEKLELADRLDDIMSGLDFWKEHKSSSMELTTLDEMLIRWVEYHR